MATSPVALDLASLPRWAPARPHIPWPRTSSPCRGGLQRCHMSCGPRSHILADVRSDTSTCPLALNLTFLPMWALDLPHVLWLRALPLQGESSSVVTRLPTPDGLWNTGIKKCLTAQGTQLDLCVSKICSHVNETSVRRADRRHHHYQQDVWTCRYSAAQQCSIARQPTHRHDWQGM
jgi:hypothetical protein